MAGKIVITLVIIGLIVGAVFLIGSFLKDKGDDGSSFSPVEIVTGSASIQIKQKADKDLATAKAIELWRVALISGDDLSDGPCLSNKVIPDWVADIAHNPRQDIDNLPANQCSAYLSGEAKHFVEIDLEGNLIKAQ